MAYTVTRYSSQSQFTTVIHFSPDTDVPDHCTSSVSAHGGLVHVVMKVRSLTVVGVTTSLVRNSPKLVTLHLFASIIDTNTKCFNATLRKMVWNGRLFTSTRDVLHTFSFWDYVSQIVLLKRGIDFRSLWYCS